MHRPSFPNPKSYLQKNWPILAFLGLLVIFAYANSLTHAFVSDDVSAILKNENINRFSYLTQNLPGFPRRLLNFLIANLFGRQPLFFRLPNIFFHLANVILIYLLIDFTTNEQVALFAGSIFAVHPLAVESVAWISGGPYSQYAFFLLLGLLSYFFSPQNKKFFYLSLLSFFLALLSSEKAVIFPLVLLIFALSFKNLKKTWKNLIPFFTLSGLWSFFYFYSGKISQRMTAVQELSQSGKIQNPLIQIPIAVTSYLELIFWPKNLTLYHSELTFSHFQYFLRAIIFLIFASLIIYFYKRQKQVFFWLSFFFITLLPTLTPLGVSWIVAERYAYLGTVGIIMPIAIIFEKLAKFEKTKSVSSFIFIILLACLLLRTITRNRDWKNQDTLWLAAAKTSPSSAQNHNNLGDLYFRRQDFKKAIEEFQFAVKLNPQYADAYHNLAHAYQEINETEKAIEIYKKALSINPSLWQSWQNLGLIYLQKEEPEKAKEFFQKSLDLNPENQSLKQILISL